MLFRSLLGKTISLFGVAYNTSGNTWMVVGGDGVGSAIALISTDGTNFTQTLTNPGLIKYGYSVTYSPSLGLWCVVGDYGTNNIFLSNDDGNTWSGATSVPHTRAIRNVTWDGNKFVAVCEVLTAPNNDNVIFSNDGFNWVTSGTGGQVMGSGLGVASVRAPGLYPPR